MLDLKEPLFISHSDILSFFSHKQNKSSKAGAELGKKKKKTCFHKTPCPFPYPVLVLHQLIQQVVHVQDTSVGVLQVVDLHTKILILKKMNR